jgi:hypothetical protein
MKYFSKILFSMVVTGAFFTACKKDTLPFYTHGSATVLSASTNVVAPVTADSNKNVITFLWTNPQYATDSMTIKYMVQIDSSGRNFSKAVSKTIIGSRTTNYTAKELNAIVLGMGFKFNVAYDVDVRLVSSYGNNNDQFQSNTVKIKVTPYVTPPKVMPPSGKMLFIVGNATAGGWGNPVPVAAQQFTLIDSVTYQGTFFLNGGNSYVLLPVNGKWDDKYNIADASVPKISEGGVFGANMGNANIPAPAATGMYTINVDFQNGIFTVTKASLFGLLYVPGDYQGWTPATAPALGAPANDGNFDGYVNIPAGGSYAFKFTTKPDWSNSLGDGGNGTLIPGGGGNLAVPAGGYYHILGNTVANTWSATATTWSLIGSFAASSWGKDIPMMYDANNHIWTATITTAASDQFKFRANNDWGLNYGDPGKGSLVVNGNNIGDPAHSGAIMPGTHIVTLYLNNPGYYTYMIQ